MGRTLIYILDLRECLQPDIKPSKILTEFPQRPHNIRIGILIVTDPELLQDNLMEPENIANIPEPHISYEPIYHLHDHHLILTIGHLQHGVQLVPASPHLPTHHIQQDVDHQVTDVRRRALENVQVYTDQLSVIGLDLGECLAGGLEGGEGTEL